MCRHLYKTTGELMFTEVAVDVVAGAPKENGVAAADVVVVAVAAGAPNVNGDAVAVVGAVDAPKVNG